MGAYRTAKSYEDLRDSAEYRSFVGSGGSEARPGGAVDGGVLDRSTTPGPGVKLVQGCFSFQRCLVTLMSASNDVSIAG